MGALGVQIRRRWIQIIFFSLILLVGFSRLYLGVHYISDVVVSLAISAVIILFAVKVISDEPTQAEQLKLSGFILVCALIVAGYIAFLYHNSVTEAHQLRDATRSVGAAIAFAIGMYIERIHIKFSTRAKSILINAIKLLLGLAITIGIQEGSRILGTGLVIESFRYFLITFWIIVLYPLLFNTATTKIKKLNL
ncbi:MAG: phosphatase PAP2 family protein [Turicibacter sp.]|nr:phosphatase PAP2 family protein [Turicibacter sp.]